MDNERDLFYMKQALKKARLAYNLGEAPIGCIIVCGDEIISTGKNLREKKNNALLHAEIAAIDKACKKLGRWRLWDCEMYVTLEPCAMCAGAIINSRIKRVVFGCYDKKAGSFGSVVDLSELPYNHKPEICGGVLQDECSTILSSFFKELRSKKTKTSDAE